MTSPNDFRAEINRAMRAAISELGRHGGSMKDIRQLVREFEKITEAERQFPDKRIPD
jgi:HEAT repeat protein